MFMEESMNVLWELGWLAIEAKAALLEADAPPIDKRVLTKGFLCWTCACEVGELGLVLRGNDDLVSFGINISKSKKQVSV
ncbi:unnamed protein product [Prunus armeniaca]|uniref:Uncharacterized protein n=1 Tax=Prunus armeniaca TaxID=36596 RepID=A0A6J5VI83_PRUAR|nr:hypothetical protein GBA52_022335 [Prunus armeniaca]CAB4288809.1 unnamed protein product [Prunus armeniaca]CAB4319153.1 unnamed protein product [Prunus armeniaca]